LANPPKFPNVSERRWEDSVVLYTWVL